MADINQVITLGIGTPAGVPEFLTFGLQIGAAVVAESAPAERRFEIGVESRRFEAISEVRRFEIDSESRRFEVTE